MFKSTTCLFAMIVCLAPTVLRAESSTATMLGKSAPTWQGLPGTDGQSHSSDELKGAKATMVVFLCNHCPCAKGYEARFNAFVEKYRERGVRMVAFNCDSSETLEDMKQRATESSFGFTYLRDANQQVAKAFDAKTTPHVFLLDENRKIAFSGAFDDDMRGLKITKTHIADAVEDLLAGQPVKVTESRLCGCKINYEK